MNCPACGASPFNAAYLDMSISLCTPDMFSVVDRHVKVDFKNVKEYSIYTLRCDKCGEFVYHSKNLLWGEFQAHRDAHRWKERRFEAAVLLKEGAGLNERDFLTILSLLKKSPEAIKKLEEMQDIQSDLQK